MHFSGLNPDSRGGKPRKTDGDNKPQAADFCPGAVVLASVPFIASGRVKPLEIAYRRSGKSLEAIVQLDVILQANSVLPPSPVAVPDAGYT